MILVENVSNVFSNRMTSSILLLTIPCLLVPTHVTAQQNPPPPAPPTPASWSLSGPIKSIQGTYKTQTARIEDHPPTLASLWELGNGDFSIVAWPPKYCAAVHVHFIETKYKGQGNFHVMAESVAGPLVKFYPPIGQVDYSTDGVSFESAYNLRSSIHFKHAQNSKYDVVLSAQHLTKQNKFEGDENKKKTWNVDLTSRMALVLTNSRFCFAHILKAGRNAEYSQLLDTNTYDPQLKLPNILTRYEDPKGFPSLFVPPVPDVSTKDIDLLPVLRNPEFYNPATMRQKPVCNGFTSASRNSLKRAIGVISVDSWTGAMKNQQMQKREEQFYINIGPKCSWIRLWITSKDKNMDSYAKMDLSETIDIFFDQQFFVGPDSNEARPLSGNSTQIDSISIRRHWDGQTPNTNIGQPKKIVQMSYGRGAGPSLTYIEYFNMPVLHQSDFRVNLIKAANCEANLVTSEDSLRTQSANRPRENAIQFTECKRKLLKNENKDPLMAQDLKDLENDKKSKQ